MMMCSVVDQTFFVPKYFLINDFQECRKDWRTNSAYTLSLGELIKQVYLFSNKLALYIFKQFKLLLHQLHTFTKTSCTSVRIQRISIFSYTVLGIIRCSGDSFLGGEVAVVVFIYLFICFWMCWVLAAVWAFV